MLTSSGARVIGNDVLGSAMHKHFFEKNPCSVEVFIDGRKEDPMLSSLFFREPKDMNAAEREAMNRCRGRVLDVGAGAGCHALELQRMGLDVVALEQSKRACDVMRARGVFNVEQTSIYSYNRGSFDTILLLMNGFGIAGTEEGVIELLIHLKTLLAPGGRIVGDSTDIRYFKQEQSRFDLEKGNFCEVQFEIRLEDDKQVFPWIYPDEVLLEVLAEEAGLMYNTILYSDDYHFLCELYV